MIKLIILATCFLLIQKKGVLSQEPSCPVFGEDLQATNFGDRRRDIRFYMNFNRPALCNGRVTSWKYCYYDSIRGNTNLNNDFSARFFVYRRVNETQLYEQVLGSAITVTLQSQQVENLGCRNITLNENQQFQVEVNDIIAACIISNATVNPIYIIGGINTGGLLWSATNFAPSCTEEVLGSINPNDQLANRDDRTLHLSTTIESEASCRAGNNPSISTSANCPGLYLNNRFPTECDGVVTAWHYCYYPEDASDSSITYTASVAVWRFDNITDQYNVLDGSVTVIELQPVQTLARIYCTHVSLAPANHIEIRRGDFIGALLPSENYIPMVGSQSDSSLLKKVENEEIPSNLSRSSLFTESLALHLYVEIIDAPVDTGLSIGGLAGIIFFLLLLLLMGVIAMVVVYLVSRRRREGSTTMHSNTPHPPLQAAEHPVAASAFDNAVYYGFKDDAQQYEVPTDLNHSSAGAPRLNDYSTSTPYEPIKYQPNTANYETEMTSSDIYASIQIYEHDCPDPLEQNKSQDIYTGLDPYQEPAEEEDQLYSQIQMQSYVAMDIYRHNIQFLRSLGAGQFGCVDAGVWKKGSQDIPVALKTLKKGSFVEDKVKFLQEAATMAQFRHPNVVTLFGIVTEGEPIILVVELVSKGDLRKNLLEMRPDPGELLQPKISELLLKFSQHIALGMQYLSGKGFVHRDLAARNVLLSDDNICKIADFGLSRDLEDDNYYMSSGGLVPVKWTAPEAIHYKKYSTASDVWSYGCVLYEMWSLGHKPFENDKNLDIIRILESGKRLPPPPGCPRKIYHLMIRCWHPDKSIRPSFRDTILTLVEKKEEVLKIPRSDIELNPQCGSLGVPLEAGEEMYRDLQTQYSP